jgi:sterol desaturase/sphingolipid hydroxylase (fatty acid hydroxylase superfamily)
MSVLGTLLGTVAAAAAGVFVWFFFEYVLHRFAFHELRGWGIGSREHLNHHVRASWVFDRMILLAWLGVLLAGFGWGRAADVLFDRWIGIGFGAGWVYGYFFYEWHHRAAHLRGPRNRWEAWLRKHHFHHHFGHPLSNQGVSISLWDHVFGTDEDPDRVRVPRRLAMPWLLDERGEVRPEYAADYELVGSPDLDERQASIDRARAFANLVPTP